jgi:hypothetical protein
MTSKPKSAKTIQYKHTIDVDAFTQISQAIRENLAAFRKDGVLTVRPGYKWVAGWPTRKPAIVVTVAAKREAVAPDQRIPEKLGGFAVDVRQASPSELLRARDPQSYARIATNGREEIALPEFAAEQDLSGTPVVPELSLAEMASRAAKPEIDYKPPKGVTLDAIEAQMSILCHASPDAGWPTLQQFLNHIDSTLTVGMYDFTSAHVLEGLVTGLKKKKAGLMLTLDHPAKNPTADQTDEDTVKELDGDFGKKVSAAWALVRSSPKAPEWIYPTAYHIKVAVRDGSSFWLSSGNWNNSNQPDIDPFKNKAAAGPVAKKSDRDWHIIVNHKGLAQTYEAFLKNDFAVASKAESGAVPMAAAMPALDLSQVAQDLADVVNATAMAGKVPSQYFKPLLIPATGTKKIKIQPILTPDNYHDHVLTLIQSAKKTFYMQTQYIHPSDKPEDQHLADLIDAVIERQQKGVDVRIILSQFEAQGGWLDKLQAAGMDLTSVRIQNAVHNKGIVVDSSVVMLGSQNWSGDGVIRNRDASVVVFNAEAAAYYEAIFLHDWTHMAAQHT